MGDGCGGGGGGITHNTNWQNNTNHHHKTNSWVVICLITLIFLHTSQSGGKQHEVTTWDGILDQKGVSTQSDEERTFHVLPHES